MQKLHLSVPNTLWKKFKQGILLVAMLGLVTPAWADVVQILQINGEAKWFKVKRGTEEYRAHQLPPGFLKYGFAPYGLLQSGDEVCVIKPKSKAEDAFEGKLRGKEYFVTLLLADGSEKELSYNNHYECDEYFKVEAPSAIGLGNVTEILKRLWERDTRRVQTISSASSKEEPLSMPLLDGPINKLVMNGKTKVYFGWKGGTPPYTVEIMGIPDTKIPSVPGREMAMEANTWLKEGEYTVRVSDSKSETKRKFTVIAKKPAEVELSEEMKILSPQLSEKPRQLLPAFWLLQNNWTFEAYQQVKSTEAPGSCDKDFPPAIHYSTCLLIRGLKEGWDKPPPAKKP